MILAMARSRHHRRLHTTRQAYEQFQRQSARMAYIGDGRSLKNINMRLSAQAADIHAGDTLFTGFTPSPAEDVYHRVSFLISGHTKCRRQ